MMSSKELRERVWSMHCLGHPLSEISERLCIPLEDARWAVTWTWRMMD